MGHAQKKLGEAIVTGRVNAWGRPARRGLYEKIPSDWFRDGKRLTAIVNVYGEMTSLDPRKPYPEEDNDEEDNDHVWYSIEFDPAEVKRAFPKAPPSAVDWMRTEAERLKAASQIGKRDSMVKDCMNATGCTKRAAEAAHKALPQEFRRSQGKPPKNPG